MADTLASPTTHVIVQQAPSNGLGTAGFVLSLIGLFTCGALSPLGLILSFAGCFKKPNGLAIAGLLISLLDVLIAVVVFGVLAAAGAAGAGAKP